MLLKYIKARRTESFSHDLFVRFLPDSNRFYLFVRIFTERDGNRRIGAFPERNGRLATLAESVSERLPTFVVSVGNKARRLAKEITKIVKTI